MPVTSPRIQIDKNGIYIGPVQIKSPIEVRGRIDKTKQALDQWEKLAKEAMSSELDKPAVQVLQDMKAAKLKKSLN